MKFTVTKPTEIQVTTVEISVPIRYGEEDIPNDFPLRRGNVWFATVDMDTGQVHRWPKGKNGRLHMKVCDEGTYILNDHDEEVARVDEDYVPHGVIPGEHGDYIDLQIDATGKITNWPRKPDLSDFFPEDA